MSRKHDHNTAVLMETFRKLYQQNSKTAIIEQPDMGERDILQGLISALFAALFNKGDYTRLTNSKDAESLEQLRHHIRYAIGAFDWDYQEKLELEAGGWSKVESLRNALLKDARDFRLVGRSKNGAAQRVCWGLACCLLIGAKSASTPHTQSLKAGKKFAIYMSYGKALKDGEAFRSSIIKRLAGVVPREPGDPPALPDEIVLAILGCLARLYLPSALEFHDDSDTGLAALLGRTETGLPNDNTLQKAVDIILRDFRPIKLATPHFSDFKSLTEAKHPGFEYQALPTMARSLPEYMTEAIVKSISIIHEPTLPTKQKPLDVPYPQSLSAHTNHIQHFTFVIELPFSSIETRPRLVYQTVKGLPDIKKTIPNLQTTKIILVELQGPTKIQRGAWGNYARGPYRGDGWAAKLVTVSDLLSDLAVALRKIVGVECTLGYYDEEKFGDWDKHAVANKKEEVDSRTSGVGDVVNEMVSASDYQGHLIWAGQEEAKGAV